MPTSLAARLFLATYAVTFGVCAIAPLDRSVWWAENLPILGLVGLIVWTNRHHEFSTTSWVLMWFLAIMHTIGGHFTFEHVPFGWVTDTFGFERNHYDRVAHFTVGFYAYPLAEILRRRSLVANRVLLVLFPVFSIVTLAAAYELFEWWYAVSADPEAGSAVLGSQGDIWDAQKDILADTLGALCAMGLFVWCGEGPPDVASVSEASATLRA